MKSAAGQLSYGASRGAPRSGGWARRAAPTPTPSLHHARRSAAAAAAAASGDGGASSSSSSAGTATATLAPPPPSPDATAQIMNAAVEFSLRARLKAYDLIRVNVDCDARGVLEGEFRSMAIAGAGWETPLGMTARRLEVAIRGLSVDYGVLVLRRKVALKGPPPKGYTTITLNARDLGAFTQHPLFKRAAAAAVKGHAFDFDPATVSIVHSPDGGGGHVDFDGVWAADGERYRIRMQPAPAAAAGGNGSGGGANGSGGGGAKGKLRVGAMHLPRGGGGGSDGSSGSNGNGGSGNGSGGSVQQGQQQRKAGDPATVAAGIAEFFTAMAIDLDGIELSKPVLGLRGGGGGGGSGSSGSGNGGSGGGAEAEAEGGGVLDITMQVRIRSFPPLNMQF